MMTLTTCRFFCGAMVRKARSSSMADGKVCKEGNLKLPAETFGSFS
jgi:hypothetical protein